MNRKHGRFFHSMISSLSTSERTMHLRTWLLVTIIVLLAVVGCKRTNPEDANVVELRIAFRLQTQSDPVPVVIAERWPTRDNLKIKLVPVSSPADALNKLDSGAVDVAAGVPLDPLFVRLGDEAGGGVEFEAYLISTEVVGTQWLAFAKASHSDAESLSDLAGRPVGVLPVRQASHYARRILEAAGVPPDQVKLVEFNPASLAASLESQRLDAVYGPEPLISVIRSRGGSVLAGGATPQVLFSGADLPAIASIVSKDFQSKHPEEYQVFLGLVTDAIEVIENEPEAVRAYYQNPKYGGLEFAVTQYLAFPELRVPSPELRATAEKMVDDFMAAGFLMTRPNLDPLFPASR